MNRALEAAAQAAHQAGMTWEAFWPTIADRVRDIEPDNTKRYHGLVARLLRLLANGRHDQSGRRRRKLPTQRKPAPLPPFQPSPEIDGVPPPDEKLVRELRGNSRILLVYLWPRGNVTRDELRAALHAERHRRDSQARPPSDRAVAHAIDYLERKLSEACQIETKVEKNGGMYYLGHPQKQAQNCPKTTPIRA
jgi:hypothetical protein